MKDFIHKKKGLKGYQKVDIMDDQIVLFLAARKDFFLGVVDSFVDGVKTVFIKNKKKSAKTTPKRSKMLI